MYPAALGLPALVWTVNDEADMEALMDDAPVAITDRPGTAARLRERRQGRS
jgi:glycerophosphoryl diester phosphodiesterase